MYESVMNGDPDVVFLSVCLWCPGGPEQQALPHHPDPPGRADWCKGEVWRLPEPSAPAQHPAGPGVRGPAACPVPHPPQPHKSESFPPPPLPTETTNGH